MKTVYMIVWGITMALIRLCSCSALMEDRVVGLNPLGGKILSKPK